MLSGPDRKIDGGRRRQDRSRDAIAFVAELRARTVAIAALTAGGFRYFSGLLVIGAN
jgi:hypothetical protein